ncbi:hypothetical protein [Herbidospora sp. RD11066]
MDREEAAAALRAAQTHKEAVRAASRWPVLILVALGGAIFATEIAVTFIKGPWTFVPAAWTAVCGLWAGWYAHRQRVRPRGYIKRYLFSLGGSMVLHVAYMFVILWADLHGDPLTALIGPAIVAAPLFVGAYVESRAE